MQPASEASHSPARLLPKKAPVRARRSPSYLYRKGNIFYFRYAFSTQERQYFQRAEIRISLRTGFLHDARKKARQLRASLEELMGKNLEELNFAAAKEHLASKLKKLMDSCPEKKPPTIATIRQRMDQLRQRMLESADSTLYKPQRGIAVDNSTIVPLAPDDTLEQSFQLFQKGMTNSPNSLVRAHYPGVVIELLHEKIFSPEELTPESILQILNEYQKMQISLNRILLAREKGDYGYERAFQVDVNQAVESVPLPKSKSPLLSEFIEKYIAIKLQDKQWELRDIPTYRSRLEPLVEILGDRSIADITRTDMREYREVLCKLPPNRKRSVKYRNKSIQEILEMAPSVTLNANTINIFLEAAASMFEWGIREELLESNPAKSLQIKDERQDIDKRDDFTQEDIKKIFFSGDYSPENFIHPAYYWGPLIGLYSGMRLEEICQLYCEDIVEENSIWCFDINQNPSKDGTVDKQLKNLNAVRLVPIHDRLRELGFLEHVQKMKTLGHKRIFPELNKTEKTPKYGKQVSKTFSSWIKRHGITGNKTFHSLRHTFSHYFKVRNMHTDVFRQVFGHEIPELAGHQYGSKFPAKQCYADIISRLCYPDEDKS